jgi:hypothetical protein
MSWSAKSSISASAASVSPLSCSSPESLHFLGRGFLVAAVLFAVVAAFGLVVVALVLVLVGVRVLVLVADLVGHVEGPEHIAQAVGKEAWSSTSASSLSRSSPAFSSIQPRHISTSFAALAGGSAPVSRSRTISERVLKRCVLAAGDSGALDLRKRSSSIAEIVPATPCMRHGADRLAARLLDGLEDRARFRPLGRSGMHALIVAGELQGHGIAQAPGDGDFL